MSDGYIESNDESSRQLFYKKMVYLATLSNFNYINIVDFGFAEKRLYGRVTRHFEPMILSGMPNTGLKNFSSVSDINAPIQALPFVVDAFEKLKQQFDKCALSGKISKSDTYLSNLKVHKAYTSPRKLYREHFQQIAEGVATNIKNSERKIRNFDEFILKLMPLVETITKEDPFTFPAYVKSKECPINASGLAVEIADLNHENDLEKIMQFVASPNWEFYVNACNSYGFMVDMRNPWRIVADIAGGSTLEYASAYGLNTTDRILNIAYRKAHSRDYFDNFKQSLLELYNISKETAIYENDPCEDGSPRMLRRTPNKYSFENLKNRYSDQYFLEIYFTIRFWEEESHFSEDEKHRIIHECKDLAKFNIPMAIDSFERILNKTLDYSGAINYIMKRQKSLAL